MKTLTVRQLPDKTHEALRIRAARNARSMEEEARQILGDELRHEIYDLEPSIDRSEVEAAYERFYNSKGGSKAQLFRHFFEQGCSVNDVHKALSATVFPNLLYQHVRNEFLRWKMSPGFGARASEPDNGMIEEAKEWQGPEKPAAAEVDRLHAFVRNLWGDALPGDVVDSFLDEKRAETARENAKEPS